MGSILEKIEQALKDMLIGWIESNLTNMFTDVNEKVGTIAAEVGQTPSGWNGGVYQMIRGLSENVIVPIAGIIITFVLCYELISMITEKNNLHDMDTWMFFKWFFKAAVAIYLVTHTFDIVMAVFDIGQNVVSGAVKELAFVYLVVFVLMYIVGPGKLAVDGWISKSLFRK